ncbi:MAG: vsr, partial [Massilia sp.]|nr:vsr [Massilia sp.]
LDGCFWHGCPKHHTKSATNAAYWAEKVRRNRERDGETDRLLAEAGWRVLRIWEHEDPAEAAKGVAELVRGAPLHEPDTQEEVPIRQSSPNSPKTRRQPAPLSVRRSS